MKKNLIAYGKLIVSNIVVYLGILYLYKKLKRFLGLSKVKILAYHNISNRLPGYLSIAQSSIHFESQIKYITGNYEVISLKDALHIIQSGKKVDNDKFVLTFDDNYKEYYTEVLPLKRKYGFDMTIFLAVNPLQDGELLFVDGLIEAVHTCEKGVLDLRPYGGRIYSLNNFREKDRCIDEVNSLAKPLSMEKRRDILQNVYKQLHFDETGIERVTLKWDEVLEMIEEKVTIGSHTINHPLLTAIPRDIAWAEITESKIVLEKRLNKKIEYFAYPYGIIESYNSEIRHMVKDSGYLCGFTIENNSNENDLFALNRANIDESMYLTARGKFSKALFSVELSGLGDYVFLRFLKNGRKSTTPSIQNVESTLVKQKTKEKKCRCLFIIDWLREVGGTEKHLHQLSGNLDKNIFECEVVAFNSYSSTLEMFECQGIPVHDLDLDRIYGFKAIRKFIELWRKIRHYEPQIVQTYHFMSDTFGVLAARLAGVPIIISSRRDTGELKKKRQICLSRITNLFIDNYIAVCNETKERVGRAEHIPLEKMQIIYNGIDMERYPYSSVEKMKARRRLGIEEDAFLVGTVCLLRPEKDVMLLLKAICEVKGRIPNLFVLIVGGGITEKELRQFTRDHGLSGKVTFTGYVKDVREYVMAMDLVCLTPKSNEGFSNAILENMAMQKPVIATDVGGNAEVVVNGLTGYLIQAGDKDALAERILRLYDDVELREEMGREGAKRVTKEFSLFKMIEDTQRYYFELINRKKLILLP